MTIIRLLRGSAAVALATAMIFAAAPSSAADRGDRRGDRDQHEQRSWQGNRDNGNRGDSGNRSSGHVDAPPQRNWARSESPAQPAPQQRNWREQPRPEIQPQANGFDRDQAMRQVRRDNRSNWQRDDSYGANRIAAQRREQFDRQARDQARDQARNNYRDGFRDGRQIDRRDDRRDRARSYDNGYRDARRDVRRDYRDWNRDHWRGDRRYNWEGYRRAHRNLYRLRPYYAPYRGYSYRRLTIGFFLNSLFYSDQYWISDPWYYRLPPVYGPYRWVRYYDDALLVNIYTGEVVDVIHGIFW